MILTVLPGPVQVKDVFFQIIDQCHLGTIIVDLSTVDPFTSQENCEIVEAKDIGYLDAPI